MVSGSTPKRPTRVPPPPVATPAAADSSSPALVRDVLASEYSLLSSLLTATWNVSMARTSLFLAVVSATVVALGLFSQASGFGSDFTAIALVVLPVALLLGMATFVRQVQTQRESIIYVTGLSRIRFFMQTLAPQSKPYFVLPAHDDEFGIYRGPGAGMVRGRPRVRLGYALVQAHGVVAVVDAVVFAVIAALVGRTLGASQPIVVIVGGIGFVIMLGALLTYWRRQVDDLSRSISPLNPTPPDAVDAPF